MGLCCDFHLQWSIGIHLSPTHLSPQCGADSYMMSCTLFCGCWGSELRYLCLCARHFTIGGLSMVSSLWILNGSTHVIDFHQQVNCTNNFLGRYVYSYVHSTLFVQPGAHQYSEHWFKNFKWHKILSMHEALSWPPKPLLLTHQRTGSLHSLAAHSSTDLLFQETVCHIYRPRPPLLYCES